MRNERTKRKDLSLLRLVLPERIEAMERLWDSICHAEREPESPTWHANIVRERRERLETGEAKTHTLDEVKSRFGR